MSFVAQSVSVSKKNISNNETPEYIDPNDDFSMAKLTYIGYLQLNLYKN